MSNDEQDPRDKNERTVIVTEKVVLDERTNHYEPYLIQISGRETGQMHKVSEGTIKMGREGDCQIVLNDPHVSRYHCEIRKRDNGEIEIRDLGSTNGIFVNGEKTQSHVLMDGDKLLIGTRLHFKFCYQDSVEQSYQQNLFRAANIDGLTQLYNKKYFIDALSKEFSYSKRNNHALSLMMVDIDFFKKINDTHGHMAGDVVLKSVGNYLLNHLRLENIACRFGGEEFAVILRNATEKEAVYVAERLRSDIEKGSVTHSNKEIKITVSIGISTLSERNFETIEDFIEAADTNLYKAKNSGRNKTISETKAA